MVDYQKPATLEEALALLQRYGKKAVLLAGGTDVMLRLKKKALTPETLISLRGIPGLDQIRQGKGLLQIGATTAHRAIEQSPLIRKRFPALADAADVLGSVQIRNVATIGGNICTAAPSADTAPPLLVLGARARVNNLRGEREISLEQFFTGPGETALAEGEIVTELVIPDPLPCTASAYWKHQRRLALDIPILGVAVSLSLDKDRVSRPDVFCGMDSPSSVFQVLEQDRLVCREAKIALGVAAPTPRRAFQAERLLTGRTIGSELIAAVASTAADEASPRDSFRGEAWYRKEMIRVFVPRMVCMCIERIVRQGEAVETL